MSDEIQNTEEKEVVMENDADGESAEASLPPQKPEISYDDFAKLDVRIGTIIAVEVVEGADKLLKLSVDLGEMESDGVTPRPRQIVSGIRMYFEDPQYLVGKQCPFVANLAPRVIRGLESQGMIMAASTTDQFALLNPHVTLPAGTSVN